MQRFQRGLSGFLRSLSGGGHRTPPSGPPPQKHPHRAPEALIEVGPGGRQPPRRGSARSRRNRA
eukprot:6205934-Alexandrium_andersonii.AAC.1